MSRWLKIETFVRIVFALKSDIGIQPSSQTVWGACNQLSEGSEGQALKFHGAFNSCILAERREISLKLQLAVIELPLNLEARILVWQPASQARQTGLIDF